MKTVIKMSYFNIVFIVSQVSFVVCARINSFIFTQSVIELAVVTVAAASVNAAFSIAYRTRCCEFSLLYCSFEL